MYSLQYKGYTLPIEADQENNLLFGEVVGIRDVIFCEGESISLLEKDFHEAVDFYADCLLHQNLYKT